VLFQNKINFRYCAFSLFYYRNILRCTVLQMSNVKEIFVNVYFILGLCVLKTKDNPNQDPKIVRFSTDSKTYGNSTVFA